MFKFKRAFAVLALVCVAAAAFAAEPAKKEAKKDGLFYWAPSYNPAVAREPFTSRFPTHGRAVVVGDNQFSATTAFKILEKGGNAFDAAVAMAATMGLTYPMMNDIIGGDAMIIVYSAKDKKVFTYNGTGWAPKAATLDSYVERGGIPPYGPLSVEIPGSFSGWMTLLRDYGTMPLSELFAPAIDLAEAGYPMRQNCARSAVFMFKNMNDAAKAVFAPKGEPLKHGEMVYNPDYAKVLRTLSGMSYQEAEDYVYRGPIAQKIVEWSKANGGILELEDFADFHAEKVDASMTTYKGYDVYACPPNSQGWVLLEALNIVEPLDLKSMGHNSAAYIDAIMQAINLSMADRNMQLADPRFHKNPLGMIGKDYAKIRRERDMHLGSALDGDLPAGKPEDLGDTFYGKTSDTTFMAIADTEGNVVACTTSICGLFGSGQMVPGLGLMLNNRLTYFFLDPDWANFLEPRKRTMQTISPSIALKDGKPFMAWGTPGGDVQDQAKLQVFLNVVEFGMNPQQAVESPRVESRHPMGLLSHVQYPRTLHTELRMRPEVLNELRDKMNYVIQSVADYEFLGYVSCIVFDHATGRKWAGADCRSESVALGW
ncbi:MAG: gamma-glutamyltransferase family protein [Pyramidobacter sp.]|nr:gamma-glutamyltransferase family protein [Pyramidobacter sp.]